MAKTKTSAPQKTATTKKTTAKKTPVKKTPSKKATNSGSKPKKTTTAKPTSKEAKTRKELTELLSQINEEGLLFLKQQASVLIHNQAVEEQRIENEKRIENERKAREAAEKSGKNSGKKGKTSSKSTTKTISQPNVGVTIEPGPNMRVFYIVTDMTRGFFNKEEFKSIVRVCQSANNKTAAKKNLYNWLRKERGDFLQDAQIESLSDIRMDLIVEAILKDYKI